LKKKQSDAIVGLVIVVAFIALLGGIIWLKKISLTSSTVSYTALFPKIGGLQVGDPVYVNGVEKGTVSSILLHEAEVAVQFRIDETIPFTDSSDITVKNVGLMGERAVEIILSRAGEQHKPDTGKKVARYIKGNYDSGISEALGMLGNIMGEAQGLLDTVQYVVNETVADPKFVKFFGDATGRLDTMTLLLDRIVIENEPKLGGIVDNLVSASSGVDGIVKENRSGIKSIVKNADGLSSEARSIVVDADSLLATLRSISAKIDTGKGTAGKLLNDDSVSVELTSTIKNLDELIKEVDDKGLKLRVRLGFKERKSDREAVVK